MEKRKFELTMRCVGLISAGVLIFAVEAQMFGFFSARSPSITSTFPMTLVFPMFYGLGYMALLIWPIFFLVWSVQLFKGDVEIPKRSIALFGLVLLLSLVWFGMSLDYGIRYQGGAYVAIAFGLNLLIAATIGVFFVRGRNSPSFRCSLISHWLLVAWIVSFAFPYLGELM